MANPRSKIDFIDIPSISQKLVAAGRQIVYLNTALYPVVKVQVRLRERSRDQMGDIEATTLKLCSIGVNDLNKMSFAMGIAPQRLSPIITEIIGRGLICVNGKDDTLSVTELGALSLEHGCEVIETDRSILVCGITGRLLPKNIYTMNLATIQDLRAIKYIPDLIQESFTIPLQALDLSLIPNKKAVNLPDETISIQGVIEDSAEPNFISIVVAIHSAPGTNTSCDLYYKGGSIDWLDETQVLGMLEPLGYPNNSPDDTLKLINGHFIDIGANISVCRLDNFGNPKVILRDGTESLFKLKYSGRSLAFCIGSGEYPPLPIGQFRCKTTGDKTIEILRGRTLSIDSTPNSKLSRQVHILRYVDEQIGCYYQLWKKGELGVNTSISEYIHKSLVQENIDFAEAYQIADLVGQERIMSALKPVEQ